MSGKESYSGKVPVSGYIVLFLAIVIFSGLLAKTQGWNMFDFDTLNGKFGVIKAATNNFMGAGGVGARAGFLFALSLIPGVMLALGIMEIVEYYGGLKASEKLLTPLLRPLMGLPGICVVALVSSLQSTDAGAGMTKNLRTAGDITEKELLIFAAFQFTAGGVIGNYLASGSALFSVMSVPIVVPLAVMMVMKLFGANIMRLYLHFFYKEDVQK